jgi:hypothetical protein
MELVKPPVEWTIPPDASGEVEVRRNGSAEKFRLKPGDRAAFMAFFRELYRRWKAWAVLGEAVGRFAGGAADYRNAAVNLEVLMGERDKVADRIVAHVKGFWQFTDADEAKATRIEAMFAPDGTALTSMVGEAAALLFAGGEERKNS